MNPDTPLSIATSAKRNSRHWRQGTVTWGELLAWAETPASVKECGNYVLGTLRDTVAFHAGAQCVGRHRVKTAIVSRSAITLDADTAKASLPGLVELVLGNAALVHTTYSSSPDQLRLRVIIPVDRPLLPDEYVMAAEVLMNRLGTDNFDPGSTQPERYMFKPAAQELGWYQRWVVDGPVASADELLAGFDPDLSKQPMPRLNPNKRNPFEIEGVVGAFNRAYPIQEAIEVYELPYTSINDSRWQLVGTRAEGGVNLVSEGLVFSHHVTDPAWGKTCSAFDLVRLHRFGSLDEQCNSQTPVNRLPSHQAMLELASTDSRVVAELVGAVFSEELEETVGWRMELKLHPRTGKFIDGIENWDLIMNHEPVFHGLYFNELTMAVETELDLPWRDRSKGGPVFGTTDRAALCHHLEREFRVRPSRTLVDELVNTTAQRRYVNPIRDYLETLVWDGVKRVETCLPGVKPTRYTRMVARKAMTAAVARVLSPGCKWDHTLVLYGKENLGKSYWVDRMSRGFSATLGRIGDKDTLLTMQRSWIMVSDEGYSLKKADADVQKEFLTRTEDVFRMPYERESIVHKRHCVIWGTTNDEVFLRRQEGNRRFLIVKCEKKVDFESVTPEYIDQVWAEAVALFRGGELLFLDDEQSEHSAEEREHFVEEDALAGVLEAYLDTLVPEDWNGMSSEARRMWLTNRADGMVPPGTQLQTRTCSTQLWVEAMGRKFGDHRRSDLLEITASLKRVPGWAQVPGRHRVPLYGPQVVFDRTGSNENDPSDLI